MTKQPRTPAPAPEHPRRLTLSAVLEQLLARGGSDHSSVTLSRNSKGDTQIEVVVRSDAGSDIPTPDAALAKAMELYNSAREAYPPAPPAAGPVA